MSYLIQRNFRIFGGFKSLGFFLYRLFDSQDWIHLDFHPLKSHVTVRSFFLSCVGNRKQALWS
jgi:hypothetical protein